MTDGARLVSDFDVPALMAGKVGDSWRDRAAYLTELTGADAIAIVLTSQDGDRVAHARHNLEQGAEASWGVRGLGRPALTDGPETSEVRARLADGRIASELCAAPLVWRGSVIGSLVGLRVDRSWDVPSQRALMSASGLVALELEEARSRLTLQRTVRDVAIARGRTVAEICRDIGLAEDPDAMIAMTAKRIAELFGASGVSVMLLQDDEQLVVHSAFGRHEQVARAARRRLGEGISGWVAKHGEPLLLSGRVEDSRFSGVDPSIEEALIAPMRTGDRVLGVVSVRAERRGDAYGEERLGDLVTIAHDLALRIANAQARAARFALARGLEDDRRQAVALYDLARLAGMGTNAQADLDAAAALIADAFRHDVVAIWTTTGAGQKFRLRAAHGYGEAGPGDLDADADDLLAIVLAEGQARPVQGLGSRKWGSSEAQKFILAPITFADRGVGLLLLGRAVEKYAPADLSLSAAIAELLSAVVRREAVTRLLEEHAAERHHLVEAMQLDFANELTRVVFVLDLCQRLLRVDPDLPSQLATAARDARVFLAKFEANAAQLRKVDI